MKILKSRLIHFGLFLFLLCPVIHFRTQGQSAPDTIFNQTDSNGNKQGYWKKTDAKGHVIYRGYFKDNKPVGAFKRYYPDGTLKTLTFYKPANDTAEVTFYYQNGKKAAKGKYYHKKKTGTWKYYSFYEDFLSYIENYKDGLKEGTSIKFYANGDTAEILEFSKGHREGKWEQFFPGNTPKMQAWYKHDRLEGSFILFYPTGEKQVSGFYKQNSRDGTWRMFRKDGKVNLTISYKNGFAENADELDKQQNALLDSLIKNKGRFKDPEKYGIDILRKR
ncbi:MAG: hypothetical protein J7K46_08920 [Bacteroidales bacterium]|nr:hypothetical protein [Bacteroidales bacterium]